MSRFGTLFDVTLALGVDYDLVRITLPASATCYLLPPSANPLPQPRLVSQPLPLTITFTLIPNLTLTLTLTFTVGAA